MTYLADDLDDVSEKEENKKDVEKDLADLHFTLSNNATKDVKGYHSIHNNNNNNSNDNVTNEAHHSICFFLCLCLSLSVSVSVSVSLSLCLFLSSDQCPLRSDLSPAEGGRRDRKEDRDR